jgi:hypothetical protein
MTDLALFEFVMKFLQNSAQCVVYKKKIVSRFTQNFFFPWLCHFRFEKEKKIEFDIVNGAAEVHKSKDIFIHFHIHFSKNITLCSLTKNIGLSLLCFVCQTLFSSLSLRIWCRLVNPTVKHNAQYGFLCAQL